MKTKSLLPYTLPIGLLLALVGVVGVGLVQGSGAQGELSPQATLGTAFTYQGQLKRDSSPVNDICDFRFSLWDVDSEGSQVGLTQTGSYTVTNGLFTVPDLDFGAGAFTGDARWLEIAVRCPSGSGSYTLLTPRQPLTAAPYALALPGLYTQQTATSPNLISGYSGNSVTTGVVGASIGGGGADGTPNQVFDDYGTVGGGRSNRVGNDTGDTSDQIYATVSGGWQNFASGPNSTIGGGDTNLAAGGFSTVGGGWHHNISSDMATIGGGEGNIASGYAATVAGGSYITATGNFAAIGGGQYNTASGDFATIGGGGGEVPGYSSPNIASAGRSTIGGGGDNRASGVEATIGGGWGNRASRQDTTVGGGLNNAADADFATVTGGYGAVATLYGQMAYADGWFGQPGDAQASLYVMRNTSTTGTGEWINLYLDGSSISLMIADGRTMTFDVLVAGRSDGGESAGYQIQGIIENVGGSTSVIGSSMTVIGENDTAWDVQVGVDDDQDALLVQVMGNGETIRWIAVLRTAEVSW